MAKDGSTSRGSLVQIDPGQRPGEQSDVVWVPASVCDGIQTWFRVRILQQQEDPGGKTVLNVVYRRSVVDIRGRIAKMFKAHDLADRIVSTEQAPVGPQGKSMSAGIIDASDREATIVLPHKGIISKADVASLFVGEPELRPFGDGFMVINGVRKMAMNILQANPTAVLNSPPESPAEVIRLRAEEAMRILEDALRSKSAELGVSIEEINRLLSVLDCVKNTAKHLLDPKAVSDVQWLSIKGSLNGVFVYEVLRHNGYGNGNKPAAQFNSGRRALRLPDTFQPQSVCQQLVMFHELHHVEQDDRERDLWGSEYAAVSDSESLMKIDGKHIQRIETELEAYGQEIEALNILLSNRLATGELFYKNSIEDVVSALGGEKSDMGPLRPVLFAAEAYFNKNEPVSAQIPGYSEKFVRRCAMIIFRSNRVPVLRQARGQLRTIQLDLERAEEFFGPSVFVEYA